MAKQILIVGGTAGIGRGLAEYYASLNPPAAVTIMGRNEEAAREMTTKYPNITFVRVEGSSMADIRRVTAEFKRDNPRLDALILSQGALTLKAKQTSEGLEQSAALMFYGRMLFVRELLPIMPPGSRVLTILNAVKGKANKVHWDDLSLKNSFGVAAAINHVFAFNDIMMQYFSARHPDLHFVHVFPGWVDTAIGHGLPWVIRAPMSLYSKFKSISPAECAPYMARAMDGTQGWRLADEKGETITKRPVPLDRIEQLAQHTWDTLEGTLPVAA